MPDFVVIGGGIAGMAAAAHLSPHGSVTLVEMEPSLGYHTTGRSAAMFTVNYGGRASRPMARASQTFLETPPGDVTDTPFLSERGALWIAEPSDTDRLAEGAGHGYELLDPAATLRLVPALDREHLGGGLWEPAAMDLDVAALHQAFIRIARRSGAEIRTASPVTEIRRRDRGWTVSTTQETMDCDVVVDAAGAWGDEVAALAGVPTVGLQPMRRTAFMVPGDHEYARWPLVIDLDDRFYFKPDGTQILCSLSEEKPDQPCDPRPDPEDVALAIDRINRATTLAIRSVRSQWTGLRTFAPDREMVIGEEPEAPGFFWLVGQGGTGIQTSPAYGALLASLVVGGPPPPGLIEAGVDPSATLPDRFRVSA